MQEKMLKSCGRMNSKFNSWQIGLLGSWIEIRNGTVLIRCVL
jgi:hypothetical protein